MKKLLFRLRLFIFEISYPIQVLISWLAIPGALSEGEWADAALSKLEAGDILLSYNRLHFSNISIPGFYNHAAIYIGNNWVVEAEPNPGVRRAHLLKWILSKDAVCALRPQFVPFWERLQAAALAHTFVGCKYDRGFQLGGKKFYCSETVLRAYEKTAWTKHFTKRDIFGVHTVLPQDYRDATNKLNVVFEFIPESIKGASC